MPAHSNNEPAFPNAEENYLHHGHSGMNLRDYFAAKAMQAQVSSITYTHEISNLVKMAYVIADAMLDRRCE